MAERTRIFITIRGVGFEFLVSSTVKYNFVNFGLLEFFGENNSTVPNEQQRPNEQCDSLLKYVPFDLTLYFEKDVYRIIGKEWVWMKWRYIRLLKIFLRFEYEGTEYSEMFYVTDKFENSIAGSLCKHPEYFDVVI